MITRDSSDEKNVVPQGEKNVKVKTSGKEKLGYTVGMTCMLSGKLLKSLLIWPSKGKKQFKTFTPSNISIEYRAAGYSNIFYQYVRTII